VIIACDVDGVIADLFASWLSKYNHDYDDHLTPDKIIDWDISKFVKPECGKKIFDYLHDGDLYDEVPVIEGSRESICELLGMGHRVVYVTTCVKKMTDPKWNWLERHGFLPRGRHNQDDLVVAADKTLVDANLLIDDRAQTVVKWVNEKGKRAFLFQSSYVLPDVHSAFWLRCNAVKTWDELMTRFRSIYGD
jgi:5'-nucleotidase